MTSAVRCQTSDVLTQTAAPEEKVADGQGGNAGGSDPAGSVAVCHAAGDRGDHGAGRADHAEGAGDAGAQAVVGGEHEGEGGPEAAERGEDQGADGGGFAQQGLGAEERPEGAHGFRVAEVLPGFEAGHFAPEQRHKGGVDDGGRDEDPAPAVYAADPSGEGAREQHAEQQAGHDGADGASALTVVDEVGRDGKNDVGDGGEEADQDAGDDEPQERRRGRDEQQRD